MKYKPGTAAFKLTPNKKTVKNKYIINVCCDANDGDYVKEELDRKTLSEMDILMIAYFNLDGYSISKCPWSDVPKNERGYPFGGDYVIENDRFDTDDFELRDWAMDRDYLQFCGATDNDCHSIVSLDVTYYDENGTKFDCGMPDLFKLFDSEKEFIDYVLSLPIEEDFY